MMHTLNVTTPWTMIGCSTSWAKYGATNVRASRNSPPDVVDGGFRDRTLISVIDRLRGWVQGFCFSKTRLRTRPFDTRIVVTAPVSSRSKATSPKKKTSPLKASFCLGVSVMAP